MVDFYKNKKVLITGITGFKGTWMSEILTYLGADVVGYSLEPPTEPNMFSLTKQEERINLITGDVRDAEHLLEALKKEKPEIVIHMAAQPLVRESYINPAETYEINVMGTVNVCEAIRKTDSVKSFVNVTTDKVYKNNEWVWGYRECDELNGYDPYSNSKSCSELVTDSYKKAFFAEKGVAVSTARAGNVLGGGDFAKDRIIPDCLRAILAKTPVEVRNPYSTRPYQHVLEAVSAYLLIAKMQFEDSKYSGNYNIGPDDSSCLSTGDLVSEFCEEWKHQTGEEIKWTQRTVEGPHEANFLKLDCSKAKRVLGWKPKWGEKEMLEATVEWMKSYVQGEDCRKVTDGQIKRWLEKRFDN